MYSSLTAKRQGSLLLFSAAGKMGVNKLLRFIEFLQSGGRKHVLINNGQLKSRFRQCDSGNAKLALIF